MSTLSWWRSWHGAPTDHKWAVIAARSGVKVGVVSAIAWALLDYASQHAERGTVAGFDTEEYAVYSGFPETEIVAVIQAMMDKGIITDGKLTNWEKRQPKREDESTERVRKFREMKRGVTQGNAPEKDTDKDKETDKDSDKEEDDPAAPPPDNDPFVVLQRTAEKAGIRLNSPDDSKELTKLIDEGATADDMLAGIAWKVANNGGKAIQYFSQIVGPTRTAVLKRKQGAIPASATTIDPFAAARERYAQQ